MAIQSNLDREAVAALLRTEPDFDVVGLSGTGQEVISLCMSRRPKVLLLGTLVPWPTGVEGVNAVRMCSPDTEVLALAPHSEDRCGELNRADATTECCVQQLPGGTCLLTALAHGARGALHRDVSPEDLFRAVRTVAEGEPWIEPGIESVGVVALPLSGRERLVSAMVGKGCSNKDIATALGISEQTVKKHLGHIFRKLGLQDRLQLGLCVVRNPLLFRMEGPTRSELAPHMDGGRGPSPP